MNEMIKFLQTNGGELLYKTWEHLYISIIAVILGIVVAVPLGVALTRMKRAQAPSSAPSILCRPCRVSRYWRFYPAVRRGKGARDRRAVFLFGAADSPKHVYLSIQGVNKNLLESGKGIGMTVWEQIRLVELPLAVPVIMAGIRTSTIYLIGWATLASFIGGGGLGDYIFIGLNLYQPEYIIGGAVPVTILAIIIDYLLAATERKVTPKGLKGLKEVS